MDSLATYDVTELRSYLSALARSRCYNSLLDTDFTVFSDFVGSIISYCSVYYLVGTGVFIHY